MKVLAKILTGFFLVFLVVIPLLPLVGACIYAVKPTNPALFPRPTQGVIP